MTVSVLTIQDCELLHTLRKYRFSVVSDSMALMRAVIFYDKSPHLSAERTLVPGGKAGALKH